MSQLLSLRVNLRNADQLDFHSTSPLELADPLGELAYLPDRLAIVTVGKVKTGAGG